MMMMMAISSSSSSSPSTASLLTQRATAIGGVGVDGDLHSSTGNRDSHNNNHHRDRRRHSQGNSSNDDSISDSNSSSNLATLLLDVEGGDGGGAGKGEQTAVLDAAAAYMARMEHYLHCNNSDASTTPANNMICQQKEDEDDTNDKDDYLTNAIDENHEIARDQDDCAGNYYDDDGTSTKEEDGCGSRPNLYSKSFNDGEINESESGSVIIGSSTTTGSTHNNPGHRHEMANEEESVVDDSFYISKEDGFCNSSSVHESDISVTDSEAYENNHRCDDDDHDDDVQDSEDDKSDSTATSLSATYSNDIMVNNNTGNVTSICMLGEGTDYRDNDDTANNLWMHDRDEDPRNNEKFRLIGVMSPPEAEDTSIEETVVINDSAPSPATTIWDEKCDDVGKVATIKSTTTVSSTKMQHEVMMPNSPPSALLEAVADVNTPSRHTSPRPPQTPPPSTCSSRHDYVTTSLKQMLYQQESELSQMMLSIDALSSTPGRIARLCDEEIVGEDDHDDDYDMVLCEDELEYNLDDGDGRNKHELYLVKKRLMIDSNNDHNGTPRKEKRMLEPLEEEGHLKLCEESDCVNSSSFVRKDWLETSTATKELETSMTPAWPKTPSMVDDTMRSEMNSPAIRFTGKNDEAPLIAIPPSRNSLSVPTWQKNFQSCESPNSSPLASHAKEPLPPNQMNSRSSPSTRSCKQSTPSMPSSSDLKEENRTDILSVCKTSAEKFEAIQNPELMPSGSTANEEHDIEVPDTIQKLFRDADTLLQNFLASPDLAGKGKGEGYCFTPSSLVLSSQVKDPHVAASKEGSDEQFENEEGADECSLLPTAGPTVKNEEEKQLLSEGAHSLQDDTLAADAFQTKLSISKDEHKIMVSNESAADSDKRLCGDAIVCAIPEKDSFFNTSSTPPKTKNLASATSFVNSVDDNVDISSNLDSGNHLNANDTFDTAIGSLGRLEKDFDRFFDAREMMDDNTPADGSFDDMQSRKGNIYGIVFAAEEVTNGNAIESADGVDLIEPNEVPSLEQARVAAFGSRNGIRDNLPEKLRADNESEILSEIVEANAANQPKSNSDFLTMNNHLRNLATGHFSITSVKSDREPTSTLFNEEVGVSVPIESISQTVSNETTVSSADQVKGESQAIDEETRKGQSNLGILDESVLNESIFMPNVSNDATSNSPESPDPTGLLTSEDESEEVDDGDDEAFFPNLDFTSRTKVAAAATENSRIEKDQPPVLKYSHMPAAAVSSIETKQAVMKSKSTAATVPSSSRSLPPSKVPLRQNTTRNVSFRANPLPPREGARKHPTSSVSMKFLNRSSSSDSLPERNRKVSPTWSPPSGMKPAKKRSRSLNVVSSAPEEGNKEKNKRSSLADMSLKATSRHGTNLAPERRSQGNQLTVRGKSESKESMGKENNQVENTTGRLKAGIESSRSMKQSLVSVARARRQSESQLPSRPTRQKEKKIDMERLTRLAEPRHRRSMVPPLNNDSPAKSVNKDAKTSAPGPPSFLSRTSSRPRVKSTAELETEEMERMKPFKAQAIRGCSIAIKSRYKTETKLPIPSSRAFTPSPSYEPESSLVPPTAPKNPASHPKPPASHHRRESALYKPTPVRKQVQTFGESVQRYLNHGLRNSLPSPQIALMSTPKPPSFLHRQSLSNNAAIKSSEEIELEECQKQFRARAISFGSTPITVIHRQGRQMPVPRRFPLAQRQWRETPKREKPRELTTPSPFCLHTNLRAESNRPTLMSADEFELSKKFRALPLPNSSTRFFRGNYAVDVPYHIRAQQQYELAKQRKETIAKDVFDEYDGSFKARPVPKTTYEAMPLIEKNVRMQRLTQPKPPRLSLSGRAEARKLFDQHSEEARKNENAMKQQKKQQQKEIEEEEIQKKRRSYAEEGGFCFKAKQIRIEYV